MGKGPKQKLKPKKDKPKTKHGRPKIDFDEQQKVLAGKLASIGCNNDVIAYILDCSGSTLDRRIAEDPVLSEAVAKGKVIANSKVVMTAFEMAISKKHPYMTTFWLRCKMGWKEPPKEDADGDKDGEVFTLNYTRQKAAAEEGNVQ